MPTRAGCENCDWEEEFENYGKANDAAYQHDCGKDNVVTWVKDVE